MKGQELVEHDREAPGVGALVAASLLEVFGRHVGRGANESRRIATNQRLADGLGDRQTRSALVASLEETGDAPVDDVDLAVGADDEVLRLEVSVDDAAAVGVVDRAADLLHEPNAPLV